MNHQGHYSKMELENGSETLIIIKSWILLARDSEEKIPGIRSDSDTVAAAEQLSSGCFPQNTLQTSLIESPLVVEITARIQYRGLHKKEKTFITIGPPTDQGDGASQPVWLRKETIRLQSTTAGAPRVNWKLHVCSCVGNGSPASSKSGKWSNWSRLLYFS
ncbi:uncharacterized protein AB9X84_006777 isoform 1-T1 [Acanthopagrus schlegelii]